MMETNLLPNNMVQISSALNDFSRAALNVIKAIGNMLIMMGKQYIRQHKSNNWLKMHGLPMRRRMKCKR